MENSDTDRDGAVRFTRENVLESNEENILPQDPNIIAKAAAWLQPTEYNHKGSEYQKHLSSHLLGTGDWVPASDAYRKWHDSDEHGLLWVRGVPGSGKSVLAASLIHRLSQEQLPVLYIFFRQIIDANHGPDAALRDWLTQTLPFSVSLQLQIGTYLGENNSKKKDQPSTEARKLESLSVSDMWQHLRTALSMLPKSYIVVDAIDEMDQSNATDEFLRSLSAIPQWKPSHIKVLVTSRPLATIERAWRMEKILHLRLEEVKIDSDIALYVKSRLDASSIPPEHHQAIQANVPGRANGLFLYAKLAMDAISKEDVVVEEVLRELPLNLNVMYTQLLREHAAKTGTPLEIQLLIMQAATHSNRPLRLIEMADMIATAYPAHIQDLKAAKSTVRSVCGPLLDVLPDETLCVVHHSLTEFLNGSTRSDLFDFPVLEGGSTHSRLAIICLSYLQSGCLARVVDATPKDPHAFWTHKPPSEDQVLAPFTKYAAANWYIHARKAISHEIDQREIHSMIDKFALHADFQKWATLAELRRGAETVTPLFMAVFLGLTDYMNLIMSRSHADIEEGGPLCHAAEKGYVEIVEILLGHGANPAQYDREGYTALHLAAKNNHALIVSNLLQAGCDVNVPTKIDRRTMDYSSDRNAQFTSLWYACNYGHVNTVEMILPYIRTPENINEALYWAVKSKKSDVAEKILQHPMSDVNGSNRQIPLYIACSERDLPTIKVLIAAGADPNHSEKQSPDYTFGYHDNSSCLHALSAFGGMIGLPTSKLIDPDITKECFALLINAGAKVNQIANNSNTPLHVVHDPTAARALLAAGADVSRLNKWQETPAHTCTRSDTLRVLVEEGMADIEKIDYSGLTPLLSALNVDSILRSGDDEKPFTLLDLGARASVVDKKGNTAIHYVVKGHRSPKRLPELIRRLCEAGADINGRNENGEAPIHLTSIEVNIKKRWGQEDTESRFQALVDAGADLTPRNDASRTPLFNWVSKSIATASDSDLSQVNDVLRKCGVKYDITDEKGRTLLHAAMLDREYWSFGKKKCMQFLVDNGVDSSATDNEGNTLWHEVVPGMAGLDIEIKSGPPESFIDLLQRGVNPQQPNKRGQTPLHFISGLYPDGLNLAKQSYNSALGAGHSGKTTIFDIVLSYYHPNVDVADNDGITPLHLAATFSEYQTVKLLEAGSNPCQANREGLNAFHISARSRMPNIMGILITHLRINSKSDLLDAMNSTDALGRTPLYYACNSGSLEIAKMLVDAGADVDSVEYKVSPWKACADCEHEVKSWSQSYDPSEGAGGVLLADKSVTKRHADYYHPKRFEELFEFLISRTERGPDFIDMAIDDAAEQDADRTVDLLLRARKSMKSEERLLLTAKIRESIDRRQAARDDKEPCKRCNRVHETSHRQRLKNLGDYHLLPEIVSPKELIEVQTGRVYGITILHELASFGFASVLSRMLTLEHAQILENRAWIEEQESMKRTSGATINKGSIEPLLLSACRRYTPNMDVIRVLVDDVGVNVNAQAYNPYELDSYHHSSYDRDFKGESALHVLVRGEHWWQVALALPYLLEHGANVELRDSKQLTPLSAALDRCGWLGFNKKAVELLVKHGADVNSLDGAKNSCLAKALFDENLTQLLLDHGAKVTRDVFIQVLNLKNVPLLRFLLSRGADPNVCGISTYKVSNTFGNMSETTYQSPQKRAEVYHDEYYPLHHLLARRQYGLSDTDLQVREEMIRLFLDSGANPCAEYDGTTILHALIREGANINSILATPLSSLDLEVRDYAGDTPLLLACHPNIGRDTSADDAEGRTLINLLLLRGADVHATNDDGMNILHYLAQSYGMMAGKVADVEPVIASAPNLINQFNKAGKTPLHIAMETASWNPNNASDLFISNGGDIHAVDAKGNTMLHLLLQGTWKVDLEGVVNGKLLDISQRLLSMGANINARNEANETPIFSLFRKGGVDVQKPPQRQEEGQAHSACNKTNETPIAAFFRKVGVDVQKSPGRKEEGQAHRVPDKKIPEVWEEPVYEVLTGAGVDWKALNERGQNLLHIVAADCTSYPKGRTAARFKALISMGLDPGMEDKAQRTPVDIAAELGNQEILALFIDK